MAEKDRTKQGGDRLHDIANRRKEKEREK